MALMTSKGGELLKEFIYDCDGFDEKTGLMILKKVDGETIFPTKEPTYSFWTKVRWKLEKILNQLEKKRGN